MFKNVTGGILSDLNQMVGSGRGGWRCRNSSRYSGDLTTKGGISLGGLGCDVGVGAGCAAESVRVKRSGVWVPWSVRMRVLSGGMGKSRRGEG